MRIAALIGVVLAGFALSWASDPQTVEYQTVASDIDGSVGKSVEWFGSIDQVVSLPTAGMEVAVSQIPLGKNGIPLSGKYSQGRFIFKVAIPLDTLSYRTGCLVHVTGTVSGAETRMLGSNEITWPVISATGMCLWERKLPIGSYHCVNSVKQSAETEAETNHDKFAVACDQDGYYWAQSKFCDFVPSNSTAHAGEKLNSFTDK